MAYFDDVTGLGNGIGGETLHIATANPKSFFQAISEPGSMPESEIRARLFLPAGPGVRPVVVVVPGSLGVGPPHVAAARRLTTATILPPRNADVTSSCPFNQLRPTTESPCSVD